MKRKGTPHKENITHNPTHFAWQHKAIKTLSSIGININPEDVLSQKDYSLYKRRYGVGYGYY